LRGKYLDAQFEMSLAANRASVACRSRKAGEVEAQHAMFAILMLDCFQTRNTPLAAETIPLSVNPADSSDMRCGPQVAPQNPFTHTTRKVLQMSRLLIPSVDDVPSASKPLLAAVQKQLGIVPNMMKLLGNSAPALEGYLSLSGALSKGALDAKLRESLALAVAEFNGCDYCLAAHTYIGKNMVKLSDDEINRARDGLAITARNAAALRFARRVTAEHGRVTDSDLSTLRSAGFDDAETIEIVLNVALNVLTNYVNNVAHTDVDFPRVSNHSPA
jgi:uncharacterized peroxidase-related enzyme